MAISRWIFVIMRNVSYKVVEKIKTHFMFSNFSSENRAVYEIMWKNMVELDRPQTTYYGACTLHAGYLWLLTHTRNM